MPDFQHNSSQRSWPRESKYKNTLLYFSGTFDTKRTARQKAKKFLDTAQIVIFSLVGILGIAAFAFQAYKGNLSHDPMFFLDKNAYNLFFVLSLYADLYLWSHARRASSLKQRVNLISLEEHGQAKRPLDVYSYFSPKAREAWDKIVPASGNGNLANSAEVALGLFTDPYVKVSLARMRVPLSDLILDFKNLASLLTSSEEQELITQLPFEAFNTALKMRARTISSLLIFYTLLESLPKNSRFLAVLRKYGIDAEQLEAMCGWQNSLEILNAEIRSSIKYSKYKVLNTNKGLTSVPTPYLDQFSVDLTAQAKYGHLPFAYGRENDLEEIFKLFSEKIRFVLIKGPEGTGRSALLNELAYKMVSEEVPGVLQDKRLIKLEISSILGGNVPPEAVISSALSEAEHNDNVILAIEEVHLLAKAQGSHFQNLLQLLVNHLQESNLTVIATTTPNDYLDYVRTVGNFEQLFNMYELSPLSDKAITQSLCVKATMLENKYDLFFTYDAILAAVKLSGEFFSRQGQPQAAITLLTEVATKAKNSQRDGLVSKEDIEKAVAEKTHVPEESLNSDDSEKLLNLEEELGKRVVGQKAAVVAVSNAIRRSRSGLSGDSRPVGSFLFVGPTGVGKTELAKSLAKVYFGDEKFFLRLDMSEYQGNDGLQKLLGTPNDNLQTVFIKHLKEYPFCLLLLDEFEKASREVWNLFLQVLDDGRLTTTGGETLTLKNTIIIATSNAGTANIQKGIAEGLDFEELKTQLLNEILLKTFAPELLNRFDDIIVFTPLSKDEINQVVKLYLSALALKIKASKDLDFIFSEDAVTEIAERGYDALLGARPIRRYIQDHVETLVAERLIKEKTERGEQINLKLQNGKLVLE